MMWPQDPPLTVMCLSINTAQLLHSVHVTNAACDVWFLNFQHRWSAFSAAPVTSLHGFDISVERQIVCLVFWLKNRQHCGHCPAGVGRLCIWWNNRHAHWSLQHWDCNTNTFSFVGGNPESNTEYRDDLSQEESFTFLHIYIITSRSRRKMPLNITPSQRSEVHLPIMDVRYVALIYYLKVSSSLCYRDYFWKEN